VPPAAPVVNGEILIPGPLKPFMRMAAISQQASPEEVVPLLARNIEINGYHGSLEKNPKETEFLVLLKRYLHIAKELQTLAVSAETIQVANCREADQLLAIIGYRLKQGCGPKSELEAEDADRAFITNDSGFPISDLEEALRQNKPFVYRYNSSRVPVVFKPEDWKVLQRGDAAN